MRFASRVFAFIISILGLFCCLFYSASSNAQSSEVQPETAESVEDYITLTKIYHGRSIDKALEYSMLALDLSKKQGLDSLLAKSMKNVGVTHYYLSNYSEALLYYDSAILYFERLSNKNEIANIYNNIGVAYHDLGNLEESLDYYLRSLSLKEEIGDSLGIGHNLTNIGSLYFAMKSFQEALDYYTRSREIAVRQNDFKGMLSVLNNMGLVQTDLRQYDKALPLFRESIQISQQIKDVLGEANAYHNIGRIHLEWKNYDSAMAYFDRALEIYAFAPANSRHSLNGKGQVYFGQKNYRQAIVYFNQALGLAHESMDDNLRLDALRNLFESWHMLGDKDKSIQYLLAYQDLFDSVRTVYDSAAIQNLQARILVDRKLAEIENLQKEKQFQEKLLAEQRNTIGLQHLYMTVSVIASVIFLVLLLIVHRLNKRIKSSSLELSKQNLANKKAKEELSLVNKALAEQENLLRTLINSTPDIICFKDGQGRWLEANEADLKLFGLEDVDYHMKTDSELAVFSPFFTEAFKTCMITDEITWQKKAISRGDEVIQQPKGPAKVYDVIKVPVFNDDGSRNGLIVLGRDITQRKQTEDSLTQALLKAEESDKLKSAFLANMSHEIRTPLNAIIGFSGLLTETQLDPNEHDHFVRLIHENGNALLQLIGDIIDLSRIEAGELKIHQQETNLSILFRDIYKLYITLQVPKKPANFVFRADIPEKPLICLVDEQRIRQIMTNLLDNAFKFTDAGEINFGFKWENQLLNMWVSDSGIGIPEEKKPLIFKRFIKLNEQTKRVFPGTGLGLSIVEQLVNLMQGNIRFESTAGMGTIFHITIPLENVNMNEKENDGRKKLTYDYSGKLILIVEDVESNFELLKVLIEPTGAEILWAVDGQQAVDLCFSNPEIDLVLMDIQLPLIDGLEATRQIKSRLPFLPIIAQTAYALVDEKEACFEAGCDGYIAKPIRSSYLLPVLDELIHQKRGRMD